MLKLFGNSKDSIEAVPAQTLDQLWHEAEQLGRWLLPATGEK